MKTKNKLYWCALLLSPAIAYYLFLLGFAPLLIGQFILSFPLSIALGLFVMIWVVLITFYYVFSLTKEVKTSDEGDKHE